MAGNKTQTEEADAPEVEKKPFFVKRLFASHPRASKLAALSAVCFGIGYGGRALMDYRSDSALEEDPEVQDTVSPETDLVTEN